ncbi:N-acyl-L-amino acid amidohydrolase [Pseudomonas orientalis]|uniref:M20 aminoacylase family protein n=1 Tax=Pseudomonas orientalis TaxID=76758 RepID=UPI000F5754C7|nr:M20 aminoacylase family protein [Pseudomonas orientalis]AZE83428.1 N-acyl-L-amino acid amidohydrolase [Pseudomonas orientalis]
MTNTAWIQVPEAMYALRRDIHRHPELAFEERRTADLIASQLESWGLTVHRGLAGTGVVGILRCGTGDASIGLRADMDALPVQELNQFEHASAHLGKMHACGHDGHCAMLLAAAFELARTRQFDGTLYFIFQPAEECDAGARRMIEDGLFDLFPMGAVFGMHNWPGLEAGQFAVHPGAMMASDTEFRIRVFGKGGHAALPHQCIDPLQPLVHIAQAFQSIITRNVDTQDPAVISVTNLHAGNDVSLTVIPDDAWLGGTFRAFSREAMSLIEMRMTEIAHNIADAFGCRAETSFKSDYPPLINHPRETNICIELLRKLVGEEQVITNGKPTMAAEDFAHMLEHTPGCYVFIGNGEGGHRQVGHGPGPCVLHNASFDFNDDILPIGATYWVRLAEACLPLPT